MQAPLCIGLHQPWALVAHKLMAKPVLLIGDIGGTNARFALADPEVPGFNQVMKLSCVDFETAEAAIAHFLEQQELATPDVICLAAAGPVLEDTVRVTNNHWHLDRRSLTRRFSTRQINLLNDFEAVAYSLPFLGPTDTHRVGLGAAPDLTTADFNVGVLGPGTGLGVAGLLGRSGAIYPIVGEGGHRGFAPETAQQIEVLEVLRKRFERVSDERLVSGPGLENIYSALRVLQGEPGSHTDAADIFSLAKDRRFPIALEAVKLFFETLGQVAGDLALELGAADGIFIAGGIVQRYPELLEGSGFRSAFEHKGRHRSLLEQVPTLLITHPDPGLLGVAYCALQARKNPQGSARKS